MDIEAMINAHDSEYFTKVTKENKNIFDEFDNFLQKKLGVPISETKSPFFEQSHKNLYRKSMEDIIEESAQSLLDIIIKNNITDNKLENMTLQEYQEICKSTLGKDCVTPTQEMFDAFKQLAKKTGLTNPDILRYVKKEIRYETFVGATREMISDICKLRVIEAIAETSKQAKMLGWRKREKELSKKINEYASNANVAKLMSGYFTLGIVSIVQAIDRTKVESEMQEHIPESKHIKQKEFVSLFTAKCAEASTQYFYNVFSHANQAKNSIFSDIDIKLPQIATENAYEQVAEFANNFNKSIRETIGLPINESINDIVPKISTAEKLNAIFIFQMPIKDRNKLNERDNAKNAEIILDKNAKVLAKFIIQHSISNTRLDDMTFQDYQKMCKETFGASTNEPTQEMFDTFKQFARKTGLTNPDTLAFIINTIPKKPYDNIFQTVADICKINIANEIAKTDEEKEKLKIPDMAKETKKKIKNMLFPINQNTLYNIGISILPLSMPFVINNNRKASEQIKQYLSEAPKINAKQGKLLLTDCIEHNKTNYLQDIVITTEQSKYKQMIENIAQEKNIFMFKSQNTYEMVETKYQNEQDILVNIADGTIPENSIIDIEKLTVYSPASELFNEIDNYTDNKNIEMNREEIKAIKEEQCI